MVAPFVKGYYSNNIYIYITDISGATNSTEQDIDKVWYKHRVSNINTFSGFIIVYKMRNFLNLLYFKTQQFASKYRIQNILSTTQLAQLIEITLKQRHILTFAVLFDN